MARRRAARADAANAAAGAGSQYLASKGFSPHHLLAGAFGEFQPIEDGDSEEALRRNRRIELKITER